MIEEYGNFEQFYINKAPEIKRIMLSVLEVTDNNYVYLCYDDIIKTGNIQVKKCKWLDYIWLPFQAKSTVFHHQWLNVANAENICFVLWKMFWLFFFKIFGGKIIWTLHNKYPHEKRLLSINIWLRKKFALLVDVLHVHSQSSATIMHEVLGVDIRKFVSIPHPKYKVNIISQERAYKQLKVNLNITLSREDLVLLCFGQIAQYKGVLELLEIFSEEPSLDKLKLIVAGKMKKSESEQWHNKVRSLSLTLQNVVLIEEFISNDDTDALFAISDYVIFNYLDILTSGGVVLAQSYKKRIICPNKGALQDIDHADVLKFSSREQLVDILKTLY